MPLVAVVVGMYTNRDSVPGGESVSLSEYSFSQISFIFLVKVK